MYLHTPIITWSPRTTGNFAFYKQLIANVALGLFYKQLIANVALGKIAQLLLNPPRTSFADEAGRGIAFYRLIATP